MLDRRRSPNLRTLFEELKAELMPRLERVTPHCTEAEREALAIRMTRCRMRHEYRDLLRAGPA